MGMQGQEIQLNAEAEITLSDGAIHLSLIFAIFCAFALFSCFSLWNHCLWLLVESPVSQNVSLHVVLAGAGNDSSTISMQYFGTRGHII